MTLPSVFMIIVIIVVIKFFCYISVINSVHSLIRLWFKMGNKLQIKVHLCEWFLRNILMQKPQTRTIHSIVTMHSSMLSFVYFIGHTMEEALQTMPCTTMDTPKYVRAKIRHCTIPSLSNKCLFVCINHSQWLSDSPLSTACWFLYKLIWIYVRLIIDWLIDWNCKFQLF